MPLMPFAPDRGTARDVEWGFHLPPIGVTPDTILDLGANIGLTCLDFARNFPLARIVGVELDSENVRVAVANTIHNSNIAIVHAGVTLFDGSLSYNMSPLSNAYHIGAGQGAAPAVTIDSLIRRFFPTGVDFMKVDIEGTERDIFKAQGAEWPMRVRCLSVETHYGYEPSEAVQDLIRLGYNARIQNYGAPGPGMQEHWVVFAAR